MNYTEEINFLYKSINSVSSPVEKVKILEKIISKAQFNNDLDTEFDAKKEVLSLATFDFAFPEKQMNIFPWLLAACDKYPDRFDYFDVLWDYKWVIFETPEFHNISLSNIENLLVDIEKRYKDYDESPAVIYYLKRYIYAKMGRTKESKESHEKLLSCKKRIKHFEDCKACTIANYVIYLNTQDEYEEAIKVAQPVLKKKYTCTEVPLTTYPDVVLAYIFLNKLDECKSVFNTGYNCLPKTSPYLHEFYIYILYCSLTNQDVKAIEIIENQFPFSQTISTKLGVLHFYYACSVFFKKLYDNNETTIKIKLPNNWEISSKNNEYSTEELYNWFSKEVNLLTNIFDARNGNTYHRDYFAKMDAKIKEVSGQI